MTQGINLTVGVLSQEMVSVRGGINTGTSEILLMFIRGFSMAISQKITQLKEVAPAKDTLSHTNQQHQLKNQRLNQI